MEILPAQEAPEAQTWGWIASLAVSPWRGSDDPSSAAVTLVTSEHDRNAAIGRCSRVEHLTFQHAMDRSPYLMHEFTSRGTRARRC